MKKKLSNLLGREFRFLAQPLNLWSRLLLLLSAAAIVAALFFPLWRMHLVAPQYSDGLDLFIYCYKIVGGGLNGQHLVEINNLNHYIGMAPIVQADFLEMRWMPFVFGLIILMILRSVVFGADGQPGRSLRRLLLLRHLLNRIVLVPPLPIWAQSRSARADAHHAVHAAAPRARNKSRISASPVTRSSAPTCFVFRCCLSCSPAGFRERKPADGEERALWIFCARALPVASSAHAVTLQERIDAATPNDTIRVEAGRARRSRS